MSTCMYAGEILCTLGHLPFASFSLSMEATGRTNESVRQTVKCNLENGYSLKNRALVMTIERYGYFGTPIQGKANIET